LIFLSEITVLKIFGLIILAVVIANFFLPVKEFTRLDQARNATLVGNYREANNIYSELSEADFTNIELHRKKIKSHFKSNSDDDIKIRNFYESLSQNIDKTKSNIGFYALGYIESIQHNENDALDYYLKVKNIQLPYVNNSIGYIYKTAEI